MPTASEAATRADPFRRLAWFARSSIAPPLAIALAGLFIAVNEVGHRTVGAITVTRDEAVQSRIAVEQLRAAVVAAESAQRGLMLTSRPVYRQGFGQALADVSTAIEEVRRARLNRAHEQAALDELIDLAQRKISELQETMQRLESGRRDGALELMLSDIGREQMAELDLSVEALSLAQGREMRSSGELRDRVLLYSRFAMLGLVLSCLAAVLTTMRVLRHRNSERLNYLNTLRAERDKLEETVAHRTAELSRLARHLQSVREDERSHLARELHDELGGLLTAAKLDLARLRSRLAPAAPEVAERMAHLHAKLDAGIALKRRIIEDLRPSSLDNLGLCPALRFLCDEWSAASGIAVRTELQEMSLPPEQSLVAYRTVQEALTNIAKYAQATAVSVTLQSAGHAENAAGLTHVLVQVQDNGRGFSMAQPSPGHGLAGMRFRVASIGGELTVTSAPGQGTTISARLPHQA